MAQEASRAITACIDSEAEGCYVSEIVFGAQLMWNNERWAPAKSQDAAISPD
jgi:hypothetical protein